MPTRPPSLCTKGCGALVFGGGQCPDCLASTRRQSDKRRPNGYRRGYTAEWAEFRKDYLAAHLYCESDTCSAKPLWQRPRATDIDHIDGTGRNGPRAYDPSNLSALCHSCHARLTVRHDGGFGHTRLPRDQ